MVASFPVSFPFVSLFYPIGKSWETSGIGIGAYNRFYHYLFVLLASVSRVDNRPMKWFIFWVMLLAALAYGYNAYHKNQEELERTRLVADQAKKNAESNKRPTESKSVNQKSDPLPTTHDGKKIISVSKFGIYVEDGSFEKYIRYEKLSPSERKAFGFPPPSLHDM